jgi:TRAP-type C4-dicarboxylate transport system permease large subunit
MLREAVEGTMRRRAMIMLIIVAAQFLNFVLSATSASPMPVAKLDRGARLLARSADAAR